MKKTTSSEAFSQVQVYNKRPLTDGDVTLKEEQPEASSPSSQGNSNASSQTPFSGALESSDSMDSSSPFYSVLSFESSDSIFDFDSAPLVEEPPAKRQKVGIYCQIRLPPDLSQTLCFGHLSENSWALVYNLFKLHFLAPWLCLIIRTCPSELMRRAPPTLVSETCIPLEPVMQVHSSAILRQSPSPVSGMSIPGYGFRAESSTPCSLISAQSVPSPSRLQPALLSRSSLPAHCPLPFTPAEVTTGIPVDSCPAGTVKPYLRDFHHAAPFSLYRTRLIPWGLGALLLFPGNTSRSDWWLIIQASIAIKDEGMFSADAKCAK